MRQPPESRCDDGLERTGFAIDNGNMQVGPAGVTAGSACVLTAGCPERMKADRIVPEYG